MRAPLPSLQRLLALAAVPATCGQAWRGLDEVAALLDRPLDGVAAAQGERVEAMLGSPAMGERLLPALARLARLALAAPLVDTADDTGAGAAASAASRWPDRSDNAVGGLRLQPAAPVNRASGPLAAEARWPAQGPARVAVGQLAQAPGGAAAPTAANGLRNALLPLLSAATRADGADRADGGASATPGVIASAIQGKGALPPAWMAALQGVAPQRARRRALPPIAAAQAQAVWQARCQAADLAPAWHQAVMPAAAAAGQAVAGAYPPGAGPAAAGTQAALSQRLSRTLDHLAVQPLAREPGAAPSGGAAGSAVGGVVGSVVGGALAWPRAPVNHAGAPTTELRSPPAQAAAALALPRGARLGGFKGLAALGQAPGGPANPANPAAPAVMQARTSQPDATPFAARTLIDQVEAALREQVARNGIPLGGLEP
jgi:hypothetical protein